MKLPDVPGFFNFLRSEKKPEGKLEERQFPGTLTSLHLFVPISRDDDESGEEQREGERRGGDRLDYVQQVD